MGTVERAFELAEQGRCRTLTDIRKILVAEKHAGVDLHLAGSGIRKQLRAVMHSTRPSTEASAPQGA
ncbi:hypothetical protein TPR58_10180 [Sphingomonas sp. HF-S3]|jgi:hypothetical protein|uniref:Uncharacterized protein n=1 Tax=Sphingomonas rustica TaxID=3103142 RepID=A0ABV0BBS7_9SPHN